MTNEFLEGKRISNCMDAHKRNIAVDLQQFRNIAFETRTECVVCGKKLGSPLICLPKLPITGMYIKQPITEHLGLVDQFFYLCSHCGHGQVSNVVSQKILYGNSYYFRTSVSQTATRAIDRFVSFITLAIGDRTFRNVVDIGCNDLYLLKSLRLKTDRLIGIDPVLRGREKELSKGKFKVIGDFFENIDLESERLHFDSDLVISSHTLEHVSNPKLFVKRLLDNATHKTLFAFQFPSLEVLIQDRRFDQIFHQHLNYFSLKSLITLLDELGAELIEYKINYEHWGAFMILFRKKSTKSNTLNKKFSSLAIDIPNDYVLRQYAKFKKSMSLLSAYLNSLKGEVVYGYGAAMMLPLLSYHFKNDLSCLKCVLDDDESKEGLHYINLSVTIKTPKHVSDLKDSIVLVTALENSRQILSRLIPLNPKRIIIPLTAI